MFGIQIVGPANLFCDNKYIYINENFKIYLEEETQLNYLPQI